MSNTIKSPFKFLDAYNKDDISIFFGRQKETYELYDRVHETNLVLVYGASGTGKTSLINCGLSNEFESTDWHPIFIRHNGNILESLRSKLKGKALNKKEPPTDFINLIQAIYLDYFKPVYLIFDQFEELFILGCKEEQYQFFELVDRILSYKLQCKIILSMREEYIAHLSNFEEIIPSLFDNRLRVERMNQQNLRAVITGTTEHHNIQLENDETPELILQQIKDKNNETDLVNLQVYLDRLYRLQQTEQNSNIVFDKKLIKRTGNLEDVMAFFLDEQIEQLGAELVEKKLSNNTKLPMSILFALVTDNGTKQSLETTELKAQILRLKSVSEAAIDYCLKRFKEMRILRELQ